MKINVDMSDITEMVEQCKKEYEPLKKQVEKFEDKYPFVKIEFSIDEDEVRNSLQAGYVDGDKTQISVKYVNG
ncbi:hypothetical protein ACQKML_13705 [Peribacillus frigoritolerans]